MAKNPSKNTIALTVPAHLNYLKIVRKLAVDVACSTKLSEAEVDDFILAVVEAVTNAMRHSKSEHLAVSLTVSRDALSATISDRGCGFKPDPKRSEFPSLEKRGGRGIPLMNCLVDSCMIKSRPGRGTQITLVKKLPRTRRTSPGYTRPKIEELAIASSQ